jgi:hypothetical protein
MAWGIRSPRHPAAYGTSVVVDSQERVGVQVQYAEQELAWEEASGRDTVLLRLPPEEEDSYNST